MRSLRYLNAILTVTAVLLTLNLWTAWNGSPGGRVMSSATEAQAAGIPNAGSQRLEIVSQLKKINVNLASLQKTMTSGSLHVKVDNQNKQDQQKKPE